jgi:hypothetical protein
MFFFVGAYVIAVAGGTVMDTDISVKKVGKVKVKFFFSDHDMK